MPKVLQGMTPIMTDTVLTPRTVLKDFTAFLGRPQVMAGGGLRATGNLRRWAWLTALMVAVLLGAILPLLRLWQYAFSLPDPVAFEQFPKEWLVPTVVILAPVSEELLFRGWQSGSRTALWLLVCAAVGIGAFVLALSPQWAMQALVLLLAAVAGALAGWLILRRKPGPLGWFARFYPAIFYGTAALFALVHLGNYGTASLIAVPLVLPQFWAGLVLGHIRQQIGLWAAIAAHAVANGVTIGLALAFG